MSIKLPKKLTSRKLWVNLIAAAFLIMSGVTGLDLELAHEAALVVLASVYTLAEALVDAARAGKTMNVTNVAPPKE